MVLSEKIAERRPTADRCHIRAAQGGAGSEREIDATKAPDHRQSRPQPAERRGGVEALRPGGEIHKPVTCREHVRAAGQPLAAEGLVPRGVEQRLAVAQEPMTVPGVGRHLDELGNLRIQRRAGAAGDDDDFAFGKRIAQRNAHAHLHRAVIRAEDELIAGVHRGNERVEFGAQRGHTRFQRTQQRHRGKSSRRKFRRRGFRQPCLHLPRGKPSIDSAAAGERAGDDSGPVHALRVVGDMGLIVIAARPSRPARPVN